MTDTQITYKKVCRIEVLPIVEDIDGLPFGRLLRIVMADSIVTIEVQSDNAATLTLFVV